MLDELKAELELLHARGRMKEFHARLSRTASLIQFKGQKLHDFTNWDYLNVARSPRVKRALQQEVEEHGVTTGAPRLSSGTAPSHLLCEQRLSTFFGTENTLLFSSLNQAILSLVSCVCNERDCILLDEQTLTPLQEAAYLIDAEIVTFRSDDLDTLARALQTTRLYRRKLLFLETVNPLSGAALDCAETMKVVAGSDLNIVLDESFAVGASGLRGSGHGETFPIGFYPFAIIAALGYGLGCYGACIATSKVTASYLLNRSRVFQYEPAFPIGMAAAIEQAATLIEISSPEREKLRRLSRLLQTALQTRGLRPIENSANPITVLPIADRARAEVLVEQLATKGFLVEAISNGQRTDDSLSIRIIVNAEHTEALIEDLSIAIAEGLGRA
jgi:7-keto-8-aminopelargonate synthetase-like enzyme